MESKNSQLFSQQKLISDGGDLSNSDLSPQNLPKNLRIFKSFGSPFSPPTHVNQNDWREMLSMVQTSNLKPNLLSKSPESDDPRCWIEENFKKFECCHFVSSNRDPQKCGCGRLKNEHDIAAFGSSVGIERWNILAHTIRFPTNAFGIIEFQGGPHPQKANYLRLGFDSDPGQVIHFLENVWRLPSSKLIITIHGGFSDFTLQPKLARVFKNGLIKAAKTTDAWIITSGVNSGVIKHVAAAVERAMSNRTRITCIGIAPWGMLKKREHFLGQNKIVQYHSTNFSSKNKLLTINNRHSYYLFVDNGTVGRSGADVIFRRQLESHIVQKQKLNGSERSVPMICVFVEGGTSIVRTVLDYVTNEPKIPIVICHGSGRASDILALAHKHIDDDGNLPIEFQHRVLQLIQNTFKYNLETAEKLFQDVLRCVQQKTLINVYRLGKTGNRDLDHAILNALLKGHNLKPREQLDLALAWNRADIAKSLFTIGQEWQINDLMDAMMEALIHNRVDFVKLLLENGVSMNKFLTIERLEQLYNSESGPQNTLFYIVRDVVRIGKNYRYTLPHIGLAIEKLIGNGFISQYSSTEFKEIYLKYSQRRSSYHRNTDYRLSMICNNVKPPTTTKNLETVITAPSGSRALSNHLLWRSAFRKENLLSLIAPFETIVELYPNYSTIADEENFKYPFSDLFIWAVLTKRQEMALCMWEHGEEALAKALIGCRLYKSLAKEAAEDYLEVEICEELHKYALIFKNLSLEILNVCYKQDDAQTLQLLTYDLSYWGHETCLSLAVIVKHKAFLAHPCCQILLADLWHGGLRIRSNINVRVILGLICFPTIFLLEFKSQEELKKQPQTLAEYEKNANDSSESDLEVSDSEEEKEFDEEMEKIQNVLINSHKNSGGERTTSADNSFDWKTKGMKQFQDVIRSKQISQRKGKKSNFWRRFSQISPTNTVETSADVLDVEQGNGKSYIAKTSVHKMRLLPTTYGKRRIKLRKKLYEFYAAPISSFWSWCIAHIIFIILFAHVLLVKVTPHPKWTEYYLYFYVGAYTLELCRKLIISEPPHLRKKIVTFFKNNWNKLSTIAIITFLIATLMRLIDYNEAYGRCILAISSILWIIKFLDFFLIHSTMGPLITATAKMILNMVHVVVMLFIAILSFGLARQSITYQNETWNWLLVRNIFYAPYWMFYGDLSMDYTDPCNDAVWSGHLTYNVTVQQYQHVNGTLVTCSRGFWIVPILMSIFLLLAPVLLMSLFIAKFHEIVDSMKKKTQQVWLFQRYYQVMEFESTPVLPPPLTLIYHVIVIVKYLKYRILKMEGTKKSLFDFSLKLFLTPDQVEKLHDFEEECVEEYGRVKEYNKNRSSDERLQKTTERTDMILNRINDLISHEPAMEKNFFSIEQRIEMIEKQETEISECLKKVTSILPIIIQLNDKFDYAEA